MICINNDLNTGIDQFLFCNIGIGWRNSNKRDLCFKFLVLFAESNNLIQEYPEIANELKEALEAFDTVLINEARPIGIFEE